MIPIVCLMGPTASGKTDLAVELTKHLPCDIISVDSAMVYRGLDIGTAKPNIEIQRIAPHRLLDIRDPTEIYSVGDFRKDAIREIESIIQQGRIPLLVGGTMLYFHALQRGLDDMPARDLQVRQHIQEEARQQGWPAMHAQLATIDPQAAARIHVQDSQRIQRALEVYRLTGKSLTHHQQLTEKSLTQTHQQSTTDATNQPPPAVPMLTIFHSIVLYPSDRAVLHKRIEKRFLTMLDQGFIEEVRRLYQRGDLSLDTPALRAVGYRHVWEYLSGTLSFEEMKEKAVAATRQLAKRQMTWLRRWKDALWLDSEQAGLVETVCAYLRGIARRE